VFKLFNLFKKKKESIKGISTKEYVKATTIFDHDLVVGRFKKIVEELSFKGKYVMPSVINVEFIFNEKSVTMYSLIPNMHENIGTIETYDDFKIVGSAVITTSIYSEDESQVGKEIKLKFADSTIDVLSRSILINVNSLV